MPLSAEDGLEEFHAAGQAVDVIAQSTHHNTLFAHAKRWVCAHAHMLARRLCSAGQTLPQVCRQKAHQLVRPSATIW